MTIEDLLLPEEYRKEITVIIALWSTTLNYKYYSEEYFHDELYDFLNIKKDQKTDGVSVLHNEFVENEIKGINESITQLKHIFSRFNIETNIRGIKARMDSHTPDYYDKLLLDVLKKEYFKPYDLTILIRARLIESSLSTILYYCYIAFLDLYQIHKFLNSNFKEKPLEKFNTKKDCDRKSNQVKINHEGVKVFNTVWEAVLYHSVISDFDSKNNKTKKEIPDLVKKMLKPNGESISPNTFYQKLQKIRSVRNGDADPKHGRYTEKDYLAVEQRLQNEKPDALFKLREDYYYKELY